MRGVKPSQPFNTLTRWEGYPYPLQGSRVLPGRGKGTEKIPGGYPGRTLWTGNEFKNMEKIFVGVIADAADDRVTQAVRAVVDFISYARFEVHTEESLEKMDKAWSAIHEHKKIFVELDIRESFNIPKFHSLIHYISSIRSHGTLDGYNTESPESLHMYFAKAAFAAGNKRDHTPQMTTWMSRHDACQRYKTFLRWAKGKGLFEDDKSNPEELDDGDEAGRKRKQQQYDDDNAGPKRKRPRKKDDDSDVVEVNGTLGYKVAKVPGYGNLSADELVNKFGAADEWFTWYLEEFLLKHSLPIPPSHNVPFGVYKCLSVTLPQVPQVSDQTVLKDTIRTIFPEPPKN